MQTKEPFEQLSEFGKLTAKNVQGITDYTTATTNDFLNTSAKQLKELTGIKKMEDSLDIYKQIMSENGTKLANNYKKACDVSLQIISDTTEWLENNAGFMKSMNPMNYAPHKPTSEKKN